MEQQKTGENAQEEVKTDAEKHTSRIAEIAQEALADLKAKEQKSETKGADTETPSEKAKTEEQKQEEKPVIDEVEKVKQATQKRIDELTAELYKERNSREEDKKIVSVLETQLKVLQDSLEKGGVLESEEVKKESEVKNKWAVYQKEDEEKPYAERREMTKEQLEQFFLEDAIGAQEWIIKREKRRDRELSEVSKPKEQPKKEEVSKEEFFKKQSESRDVLLKKYPSLNIGNRANEIAKEIMSEEEFATVSAEDKALDKDGISKKYDIINKYRDQIAEKVRAENKTYDLMIKIIQENEDKYLTAINGPELVMQELDKRLSQDQKFYSEDDLARAKEEAAKAERDRLASIDTGISPSTGANGKGAKTMSKFQKSPLYKQGLDLFLKASKMQGKNFTEEDYIKTLERRTTIPGANDLDEADAQKIGAKK